MNDHRVFLPLLSCFAVAYFTTVPRSGIEKLLLPTTLRHCPNQQTLQDFLSAVDVWVLETFSFNLFPIQACSASRKDCFEPVGCSPLSASTVGGPRLYRHHCQLITDCHAGVPEHTDCSHLHRASSSVWVKLLPSSLLPVSLGARSVSSAEASCALFAPLGKNTCETGHTLFHHVVTAWQKAYVLIPCVVVPIIPG